MLRLWRGEDIDGEPSRDTASALFLKHLNGLEMEGRCLGLDLGGGYVQTALAQLGLQLDSANAFAHNAEASRLMSRERWTEITATETCMPDQIYDVACLRLGKNSERNLVAVHALLQRVRESGRVHIYGPNDEGIKGFQHKLERLGLWLEVSAIGKGARILTLVRETQIPDFGIEPAEGFDVSGTLFLTPPGVFSAGRLDLGTQLLLGVLPRFDSKTVLDLGCGAGVVAHKAWSLGAMTVDATDAFLPAVLATQTLYERSAVPGKVVWDFMGQSLPTGAYDVVLTNPPFHQEHRVAQTVGSRWLEACKRLLRADGELFLVANSHLPYPKYAAGVFSSCEILAEDRAFRVLRMVQ